MPQSPQEKAIHAKFNNNQKGILEKIKPNAVLTKSEIQSIKNSLNGSVGGDTAKRFADLAREKIARLNDNAEQIMITPEHNQQGIDFLKKKPQRDLFGSREENVIDNFKKFKLTGFKNEATFDQNKLGIVNFTPTWEVVAKDGSTFDYNLNFSGGKDRISITG